MLFDWAYTHGLHAVVAIARDVCPVTPKPVVHGPHGNRCHTTAQIHTRMRLGSFLVPAERDSHEKHLLALAADEVDGIPHELRVFVPVVHLLRPEIESEKPASLVFRLRKVGISCARVIR